MMRRSFVPFRHLALLPVLAICCATSPVSTFGTQAQELRVGAMVTDRADPGGVRRVYLVNAAAGDYIRVRVGHQGVAIAAKLYAPDGAELSEASGAPGVLGGDALSAIAPAAGAYRVEVGLMKKYAKEPGVFMLTLEALRPSTEVDAVHVRASRRFYEAELLRDKPDGDSLRAALPIYREAIDLAIAAGDERLRFDAALHLALTLDYLGENAASRKEYENAVALGRQLGDRERLAYALHNFGALLRLSGRAREAFPRYEEAIAIRREIGDMVGESSTLHNLGTANFAVGEYDRAIRYYEDALALRRRLKLDLEAAETQLGLGTAYRAKGDAQTALQFYVEALAGKRATNDRRGEYRALHNMAVAYQSIGEYERALNYLNEALPLMRTGGDRRLEGNALVNAGNIQRRLGNFDTAFTQYQQALALQREMGDRRAQGEVLSNLGLLLEARGEVREALQRYEEALVLNREDNDRRGEAATLANAAAAHLRLGEVDEARARFEEARRIQQEIGDASGELTATMGLARTARRQGQLAEALRHADEAAAVVERISGRLTVPAQRASFLGTQQDLVSLHIELLMQRDREDQAGGHAARALELSERTRARTLRELLTGANVFVEGDPALRARERTLRARLNAAARERRALAQSRADLGKLRAAEQALEELTTQHQQVEAELRKIGYGRAAAEEIRIADLQKLLPAASVLLEFSLGTERSYVWIVGQDSVVTAELPRRQEIEAAARRLHELLSQGSRIEARSAARAASADLSRMLIAPIASHLGTRRLLVVPDGALHYVPFAALPDPRSRNGRPLLAAHEIVTLPSASVVSALRERAAKRPSPGNAVAVFADPVLEATDPRVSGRFAEAQEAPDVPADLLRSAEDTGGAVLQRLSYSGAEADAIEQLAPASTRKFVGLEAQRDRVVDAALADYRVLHFATHGLINSQRPELSGVVLSLLDAERQPVDGFLRLHDIYHLDLNAELVVLSACRTALGRNIRGEGLLGLTRGFMAAGARRVVASLWDVRDQATAELMKRFYAALLKKGRRPSAALREAQLSMLAEPRWSAPFFWAGFVIQGDWE